MKNIKNNAMFTLSNNQVVIKDEKNITFYSYNSCVASYDITTSVLVLNGELWDYSNTTRKHFKTFINTFIKDFIGLSYENKKQFLKEIDVNSDIEIK